MNKYENAVQWYFGITKSDAKRFCKTAHIDTLELILKAFQDNAKAGFYHD